MHVKFMYMITIKLVRSCILSIKECIYNYLTIGITKQVSITLSYTMSLSLTFMFYFIALTFCTSIPEIRFEYLNSINGCFTIYLLPSS